MQQFTISFPSMKTAIFIIWVTVITLWFEGPSTALRHMYSFKQVSLCRSSRDTETSCRQLPGTRTSSIVSSCGVAALSSESFWEPASALLRTSLLFLCLWASFLTCPSAFPLLRRLTGLVSHFLKVLPGRLGPGELCAPIIWGWRDVTEAGGLASLLETERESEKEWGEHVKAEILVSEKQGK